MLQGLEYFTTEVLFSLWLSHLICPSHSLRNINIDNGLVTCIAGHRHWANQQCHRHPASGNFSPPTERKMTNEGFNPLEDCVRFCHKYSIRYCPAMVTCFNLLYYRLSIFCAVSNASRIFHISVTPFLSILKGLWHSVCLQETKGSVKNLQPVICINVNWVLHLICMLYQQIT